MSVMTELGGSGPEMISTIARIRIDFGQLDPVRIQEGTNDRQKLKKVLKCWMSFCEG